MEKTFREKIIIYFTGVGKKHKLLKYPSLLALFVSLFFYYIGRHFMSNGKRYASIAFVGIFFVSSCSFSFAVFAERTGFTGVQETYSAVVGISDISLAPVAPEAGALLSEKESGGTAAYETETGDETQDETQIEAYTLDDILAYHEHKGAHEEEEDQSDGVQTAVAASDRNFDSTDWRLVLINKQHPISEDYEFKLGRMSIETKNIQLDDRIIEDLLLMMQAAKKDGMNLAIRSPYRTSDRQESNFNDRIKSYMRQGLSYMEAYKATSQVITVPGCSEHEVGLALDITSESYLQLLQGFADTKEGQWLAEHSHEYGFILRYPAGKEYITSIEYEPWHFRYVGREAASVMKEENLCLEEFWDKYL
ncbi:MAG: M15 family metallopeptidase [Bacteroidales bacterium]|nr:M15 family metallopeptidase [Bacteroidales bacterium]MCM1415903.1 M15 family metallopeptidase [bacterium]MCM1423534.1 M15 family metallopeptidase [bacterium]